MASLQRKTPTIKPKVMPQVQNGPVEILSNLAPEEFAKLSGLKQTSFGFQEISESEMKLRLSKNAQTFRFAFFLGKSFSLKLMFSVTSPPEAKTKKRKIKKKVATTLIQEFFYIYKRFPHFTPLRNRMDYALARAYSSQIKM